MRAEDAIGHRHIERGFLAAGQTFCDVLDALDVRRRPALALHVGEELRQRVDGRTQERDDGGRRFARAVENAVQEVLDLPAELADGVGADEATTPLERMEGPADRAQGFLVVGLVIVLGLGLLTAKQGLANGKPGISAALVFSSGYLANLAAVTTLAGEGALVVSDALNHASIVDGMFAPSQTSSQPFFTNSLASFSSNSFWVAQGNAQSLYRFSRGVRNF